MTMKALIRGGETLCIETCLVASIFHDPPTVILMTAGRPDRISIRKFQEECFNLYCFVCNNIVDQEKIRGRRDESRWVIRGISFPQLGPLSRFILGGRDSGEHRCSILSSIHRVATHPVVSCCRFISIFVPFLPCHRRSFEYFGWYLVAYVCHYSAHLLQIV